MVNKGMQTAGRTFFGLPFFMCYMFCGVFMAAGSVEIADAAGAAGGAELAVGTSQSVSTELESSEESSGCAEFVTGVEESAAGDVEIADSAGAAGIVDAAGRTAAGTAGITDLVGTAGFSEGAEESAEGFEEVSEEVSAKPALAKLEGGLTVDVSGGGQVHVLYAGRGWKAGFAYGWKPHRGMAGFNGFGLALGSLESRGLAAQLRSPSLSGVFRCAEKTSFRARFRDASFSRFGAAWMPWKGRLVLALEKRDNLCVLNLQAAGLRSSFWEWDTLGSVSFTHGRAGEEAWHSPSMGLPGGYYTHVASRLIYNHGQRKAALVLMASAGIQVRPGWLALLSITGRLGNWKLGVRALYASDFFRNGQLEHLPGNLGGAVEVLYSPTRGFLLEFSGRLMERQFEGLLKAGWSAKHFLVWMSLNEQLKISAELAWFRGAAKIFSKAEWHPKEEWKLVLGGAFPEKAPLLFTASLTLLNRNAVFLVNCQLGLELDMPSRGQCVLAMRADSLPWQNLQFPLSAGKGSVSVKYVFQTDGK